MTPRKYTAPTRSPCRDACTRNARVALIELYAMLRDPLCVQLQADRVEQLATAVLSARTAIYPQRVLS